MHTRLGNRWVWVEMKPTTPVCVKQSHLVSLMKTEERFGEVQASCFAQGVGATPMDALWSCSVHPLNLHRRGAEAQRPWRDFLC